jgi:hypothetical protein
MRNWLATSAALTLAFDVALLAVLVKDGEHICAYISRDESLHLSFCNRMNNNPLEEDVL